MQRAVRSLMFATVLLLLSTPAWAQYPVTLRAAIDNDISSFPATNYTLQLDNGAVVDKGLPGLDATCGPCRSFTFPVASPGPHTLTIVAYNAGGSSLAVLTFNLGGVSPAAPLNLQIEIP